MAQPHRRILTTHTGSLPRPPELSELMLKHDAGEFDDVASLRQHIAHATAEVVKRQSETGIDILNDGEYSKVSYSGYVKERLSGFEGEPRQRNLVDPEFPDWQRSAPPRVRYPTNNGPVELRDPGGVRRDIANLQAAIDASGVRRADTFMSAASPGVVAFFIPDQHYGNYETYLAAIAEAMRLEYRAIVEAGITLQLDCPDLAMAGSRFPSVAEFRRFAGSNVEALNHALDGLPRERLRVHICWGNYEGPHTHDVELRDIIDIVLSAHAAGLSLEACNPRHAHEWRVFEDVKLPDDRYLVPGVIDSTNNYVEHPDLVAERLLNYARLVGGERVMAGSDCGFGTFAGVSNVAPSVVWAKFKSMKEGARRATERLRSPAGVP